MIIAPTRSLAVLQSTRLDAKFHTAPATRVRISLATAGDIDLRPIGNYATVYAPSRFKRSYAVPGEEYVPYLRPYDVFEYLPPEADRLSVARTENLDDYRIKSGMLLQTCSGRNLGPLTVADEYLARFVLSHDMVRITISNESDRLYTLAFLQTPIGQHLLRGDLNGSVIDHISDAQVRAIQVPFIDSITGKVAELMKKAVELRQQSRITLRDAVDKLNNDIGVPPFPPLRDGWTVNASTLGTRIDAAYYATRVRDIRQKLSDMGGVALREVAQVTKPGGRYKTYYVGPGHGTPLLSGTQILQADPIGAKRISSRSIAKDTGYELRKGTVCFQADGRAEESLGYPSLVTSERDGWFASGHVGRVIPESSEDAGWLWAALACDAVREQVAALACGSVVDALYPEDLENVVLPPRELVDSAAVAAAWEGFADAAAKATKAQQMVEMELAECGVTV